MESVPYKPETEFRSDFVRFFLADFKAQLSSAEMKNQRLKEVNSNVRGSCRC